ncbi:MAG TPA: hypothetical protein VN634_16920 [Candidatus Limnocylindrales bacterium]|nr:hypothetical protein [Candidatus Limnocylindrales bacterium]
MKRSIAFSMVTLFALGAANAVASEADLSLALVRIGGPISSLYDAYPGFYSHRLAGGEVLYEVCNQKTLDVFTFTEEPWSRGYVTKIWVRRAPVSTCRDETGALPDVPRPAATPRGLAIGDPESRVRKIYGEPTQIIRYPSQQTLLYDFASTDPKVVKVSLAVTVAGGEVKDFLLSASIAGTAVPK